MAEKEVKLSARAKDKERLASAAKEKKKKLVDFKPKKKIKRTVLQTMPYECFVSNYVMLLSSNIKVEKTTANLYSKTYLVPDINYSALTKNQQLEILQKYIDLLNGFDSTTSLQISMINTKINKEEFEDKLLLKDKNDGLDEERQEFNEILHEGVMNGQNGLHCRKYFTVTVSAINFETANSKFFNIESHLINCLDSLGTELIPLNANERVRLMADILCDVNVPISTISREEFARESEKMLCSPDYFDFKKDYFMFNDKYARCIYFRRLPQSVQDTIFKEILEKNMSIVISMNTEFVDPEEARTMVERKITDMKTEEITKVRRAMATSRGAFVDPIEGTQLAVDKAQAQEFLTDLRERGQKMTLCQFIMMITADSYDELENCTEALHIILRKHQIEPISAPYRQEQAFDSVLPIGNSFSLDREKNIQVRRTLSSESTAVFCPFNARELMHEGGIYYGTHQKTNNVIMFDRNRLSNPNGLIFGLPGSGKSFFGKMEMTFSMLTTEDEVLILDPEREYSPLAQMLGGEVIYISENSQSHINPMDLTENPDSKDKEYDPIKAKLDFLLSFFSAILGNEEITPIQKTIIDTVMRKTYENYDHPTLKEFYDELEVYANDSKFEKRQAAEYLKDVLYLYVHGSMNVFSHASNVNIHKRFVVYDTKELGKNFQTLGMAVVLENLWDRVAENRKKGKRTRIYIDEMHLMFKSEQSANFVYELYKRARKWGGIPTGITQNVADVLRSELARTLISNTQFVIMLSQNTTDQEQLAHLLDISPETMRRYVSSSEQGCGLMYADKFGVIPFDNKFPEHKKPTSKLYKTLSTKFKEGVDFSE